MTLTFEIGDEQRPKGHALLYFETPDAGLLATYIILLPIRMDIGKYIPPMLAAQFGAIGETIGDSAASFSIPPVPEQAESLQWLRQLAELRSDDLVWGGDMTLSNIPAAMQQTADAVQQYSALHKRYVDSNPQPIHAEPLPEPHGVGADVQEVLYQLMSDRDRLAELSRLVGAMRFGVESRNDALISETDASLAALAASLPARYWPARIRAAAKDPADSAAKLAQLYVERCYKLLDEDFHATEALEKEIDSITGGSPPQQDLRA